MTRDNPGYKYDGTPETDNVYSWKRSADSASMAEDRIRRLSQQRESKFGGQSVGFAAFDAAKRREVASLGGKAAQAYGTAHRFTPEEARTAALKGAEVRRQRKNWPNVPVPEAPEPPVKTAAELNAAFGIGLPAEYTPVKPGDVPPPEVPKTEYRVVRMADDDDDEQEQPRDEIVRVDKVERWG